MLLESKKNMGVTTHYTLNLMMTNLHCVIIVGILGKVDMTGDILLQQPITGLLRIPCVLRSSLVT